MHGPSLSNASSDAQARALALSHAPATDGSSTAPDSENAVQAGAEVDAQGNPHRDFPPPDYGQVFPTPTQTGASSPTPDGPLTSAAVPVPVPSVARKS